MAAQGRASQRRAATDRHPLSMGTIRRQSDPGGYEIPALNGPKRAQRHGASTSASAGNQRRGRLTCPYSLVIAARTRNNSRDSNANSSETTSLSGAPRTCDSGSLLAISYGALSSSAISVCLLSQRHLCLPNGVVNGALDDVSAEELKGWKRAVNYGLLCLAQLGLVERRADTAVTYNISQKGKDVLMSGKVQERFASSFGRELLPLSGRDP